MHICTSQVRGLLVSLKEGFVVIGILLGYVLGNLTIEQVGGWRTMYGAALVPALALGLGMVRRKLQSAVQARLRLRESVSGHLQPSGCQYRHQVI